MRGQRKPKIIKRASNTQRAMEEVGAVMVRNDEKVLTAIIKAIDKTKDFSIAKDFDCCVENALEREKNI